MQPGSKGGYFTEKSPKMLLLEWCQQQKRQKPRYKVMAAGAAGLRCKVNEAGIKLAQNNSALYI